MRISDEALAEEIIRRLNRLLENEDVRRDVGKLIERRTRASAATSAHPAIQVHVEERGPHSLGFLGLLNGAVGVIRKGRRKGWGYISAVFDDEGRFVHFERTSERDARALAKEG